MPETVTLSFRVPVKKAKALARIAKARRLTKTRLLEDALDEAIAYDAWYRAKVAEGIADADAGRTLPQEEVMAELEAMLADAKATKKRPPARRKAA